MEFCSAILEAKLFLQDCSEEADFWKNAYNSLTKLQTGEAYHVLLYNLIWSKARLHLAILYGGLTMVHPNIDYSKQIKDRVEECECMLSRYTTELSTQQYKLDMDMFGFYPACLESSPRPDENQKKCSTFLRLKYTAYRLLRSYEATDFAGGRGGNTQYLDLLEIDPHDVDDDERFLGHGSYGYVCRRSWLGRTVAVKVFKADSGLAELFKKEACLLAALQNPFIVHMVGWFTDQQDGSCMLVMELAATDLKKVINQRSISLPAAVDIMLQISKGMEYLHEKRVIHGDLKPSNVLLEPSSVKQMAAEGYARVKLCDFGFAKVKEGRAKDLTQYSTFKVGTSYYRAPEVLFEDEDAESKYTRKADVFSFAITCSEILAGKSGATCYEKLTSRKIREKMLANVRPKLAPHCPSHLADLINRCWDTDPKRRPPFSRVSNTLTYIKCILLRVSSDVQRVRPYASVVSPFDEEELKWRVSGDDEKLERVPYASVVNPFDEEKLKWRKSGDDPDASVVSPFHKKELKWRK